MGTMTTEQWLLLPNFSRPEFVCGCGCGKCEMAWSFMIKLQTARIIAGVPFHMNSGDRCFAHNAAVGGKPDSSHPKGKAGDVDTPDNYIRSRVLTGLRGAGFTRIGIGEDFVHGDDDRDKPQDRTWLYGYLYH